MANMNNKLNRLTVKGARIMCKNFSGKEKKDGNRIVNKEGERNFLLCIDPDEYDIEELMRDNWNVKTFGERKTPVIPVKVRFDIKAPKICTVIDGDRNFIDEDNVKDIDWMEIDHVDVTITQSYWEVNGRSGYASYLKTMYLYPIIDELDAEYAKLMKHEKSSEEVDVEYF